MDLVPIAIAIFLGCVLISRIMGERALRQLSPDEKVRLLDAFSTLRAYSFVPLIVIVLAAIGLPKLFPNGPWWLSILVLSACGIYVVALHVFEVRKIGKLGLPQSYTHRHFSSRYISYVGIVILFCGLMYDTMNKAR